MPLGLKAGEVLRNRYKILERIGQGGMGNIYLADDIRLQGRQCALKEVEYDRKTPQKLIKEAREQFFREATVLARLDHPNLPKVSDYFSIGLKDYLVMDFVPGDDLRTIMMTSRQNNKFLAEKDIIKWAEQLIDALSFLHHQNPPLVHRDIKPGNLKLTPSGLLKLVDFGLVKILAPDEATVTVIQGRGTALYTPLEQYGDDGQHTDSRSDIYSFGATFYHLATNQSPADARQRFIDPESLIPPSKINPSISNRLEKAILWAMALHPADRPDSIDLLKQSIFGEQGLTTKKNLGNTRNYFNQILSSKPEIYFVWMVAVLLFASFIISILHT